MRSTRRLASRLSACALALIGVAALNSCVLVELGPSADVRGTVMPEEELDRFTYTGAAGTLVSFTVTAATTAGFEVAVTLSDPEGDEIALGAFAGYSATPGKVRLVRYPLPASGRYTLSIGQATKAASAVPGEYHLVWKAGKGGPARRLDVRPAHLGRPGGGETAVGATVSAAEGGVLTEDSPVPGVVDPRVEIPAGALPRTTYMLLLSAAPPAAVPIDWTVAGPAFSVEPPLTLRDEARVTLPYDAWRVARDADPATDLRVLHTDRSGSRILVPDAVDLAQGAVTVSSDRLGRFVVIGPAGPVNLDGRTYWTLSVAGLLDPSQDGDSRARRIVLRAGEGAFDATTARSGTVSLSLEQHTIGWTHADGGDATLTVSNDDLTADASWTQSENGSDVALTDTGEGDFTFDFADDGSAAIGRPSSANTDPICRLDLALFRRPGDVLMQELAGTWNVGVLEVSVGEEWEGPVSLEFGRSYGTITLLPDGTWKGDVAGRRVGWDSATERPVLRSENDRPGGRWQRSGEVGGAFDLVAQDPEGEMVLRLLPGGDAEAFVAYHPPAAAGDDLLVLFAVRAGNALTTRALRGPYADASFGVRFSTTDIPAPGGGTVRIPDFAPDEGAAALTFDGTSRVSGNETVDRSIRRDETAAGGVVIENESEGPFAGKFRLQRNGRLTIPGERPPSLGALTPRARFGFIASAPDSPEGSVEFELLVKRPEAIYTPDAR